MVFSSPLFLFFFLPAVLIVYYNPFFKNRTFKNTILLLASLFFYAWGEPLFVFVMIFSIFVNWIFGRGISGAYEKYGDEKTAKSKAKKILVLSLVWNVGILFVFKYFSFLLNNFRAAFSSASIPEINIALPIGISFFSFQIMSYIFDVYYRKASVQKNVFDLALYISFFPQLIAGPIVRYETVAEQICERKESPELFTEGFARFAVGLGKKCLLANYMAVIADSVFTADLNVLMSAEAWTGIIAYTLQIYFDFSGYSDMAIGLGRMFGFHFNENFNYPYAASSITDFWRRWHISLSSWFRDYVYIPMGGNRCSKPRWILNLFTVWALTGIWHGANWTFLIWGVYYFILLLIEKLTGFPKRLGIFSHVYTLLFVMFGWVLFRSENLANAALYFKAMFNFSLMSMDNYIIANGGIMLLVALVFAFPVAAVLKKKWFSLTAISEEKKNAVALTVRALCVLAVFCLSILSCIKSTYNPFIYFNF